MDTPETVPAPQNAGPAAGLPSAPRKRVHRRVLLLVVGCIVLLLMVGGGTWAVLEHFNKQEPVKRNAATGTSAQHLTPEQQASKLAYKGDYAKAQEILAQQLKTAKTVKDKVFIISQQVTTAQNAKKYDDALHFAQTWEDLQSSSGSANAISQIYAAEGNKKEAVDYLNLAMSRLDKNSPSYNVQLQMFQAILRDLQS